MSHLSMLNQEDIQKIHVATMEVLENVGVEFNLGKAIDLFKSHGFRTDGNVVFFTEKQVMDNIATAPRSFTVAGRNPEQDFVIGGGFPCVGAGSGYVSIITPQGQRPAQLKDSINFIKLQQSSDCNHLTGGHGISSMDITGDIALAHIMLLNCYLSDKPLQALGFNATCAQLSLDLLRIIHGQDLTRQYVCLGVLNPTSPLHWVKDVLEPIFAYAESNQPIRMAPAGMLGATMPVTTAGGIVCAVAENLSGVVLTQLLRPGLPVIAGNTSSCPDMKSMVLALGAPEGALMAAASNDMFHYYGLPTRSGGPLSDAKEFDYQAGAEAVLNMLVPMISGSDFMLHMGMCDSYNSFSYEKFIADEDVFQMCSRILKGTNTAKPELALDQLQQFCRTGGFLRSKYTVERFREEFWRPRIFERRPFESWKKNSNSKSLQDCCQEAWQKRLKNFTAPEIDPALTKELWGYVHGRFGKIDWLTPESSLTYDYQ